MEILFKGGVYQSRVDIIAIDSESFTFLGRRAARTEARAES